MSNSPPLRLLTETDEPPALHARAMDNLRFIRETMERAAPFTAVSGWGVCATGGVALVAAALGGPAVGTDRWLATWMVALLAAAAVSGAATVSKARRAALPLLSGPVRKFLLAFSPPMLVGALLTAVLLRGGDLALLPGTWMLLYGTAVMAAGTFSVRLVPAMGGSFLLVGALALFAPAAWGAILMAVGFGGLHLAFGAAIARSHGG